MHLVNFGARHKRNLLHDAVDDSDRNGFGCDQLQLAIDLRLNRSYKSEVLDAPVQLKGLNNIILLQCFKLRSLSTIMVKS